MFSNLFYKEFGLILTLAHRFGYSPFLWNFKRRRFYTTKNSRLRCLIQGIFITATVLYLFIRTLQADSDGNMKEFNITLATAFIMLLLDIVFLLHVIYPKELAACFNALLDYVEYIQETWMKGNDPNKRKSNNYLDRILIFLICYSVNSIWIFLLHYWLIPESYIYPNNLLPKELQTNIIVFFIIGFIFYIVVAVGYMTFLLIATFACVFIFSFGILISCEFKANQINYITDDELRSPYTLVLSYRKLELIHKHLMHCIGNMTFPIQAVIGQVVLICNYILIRQSDSLDGINFAVIGGWAILFQTGWVLVLNYGGLFYKHAVEVIISWKYLKFQTRNDAKYMSKFRKSCKPLTIETPGLFRIRRLTVLNFLKGVVKGTIRMLLALQ